MRKNNPYGYKIGYRENGSLLFNRLFITRSYNHAVSMRNFYRRYIKQERNTKRLLINPFWEILPITKKEILAGIWDEVPFRQKIPPHLAASSIIRVPLSIPTILRIASSLRLNAIPFPQLPRLLLQAGSHLLPRTLIKRTFLFVYFHPQMRD